MVLSHPGPPVLASWRTPEASGVAPTSSQPFTRSRTAHLNLEQRGLGALVLLDGDRAAVAQFGEFGELSGDRARRRLSGRTGCRVATPHGGLDAGTHRVSG